MHKKNTNGSFSGCHFDVPKAKFLFEVKSSRGEKDADTRQEDWIRFFPLFCALFPPWFLSCAWCLSLSLCAYGCGCVRVYVYVCLFVCLSVCSSNTFSRCIPPCNSVHVYCSTAHLRCHQHLSMAQPSGAVSPQVLQQTWHRWRLTPCRPSTPRSCWDSTVLPPPCVP